jgi:hypothetical protein
MPLDDCRNRYAWWQRPVREPRRTSSDPWNTRAHPLVGANSHALLLRQISAALELGLTITEVTAAVRVAEYVQRRASEMTVAEATHALNAPAAVTVGADAYDVTAARAHEKGHTTTSYGARAQGVTR